MVEKILSFLLFITFFNYVASVTEVRVDSSSATTIYPSSYNYNYFYIYNDKSYKTTIYFYIKDKDNSLYYDNIRVCYTNTKPTYGHEFEGCSNSDKSISKYGTTSYGSSTNYYLYKYSSSSHYNYLSVEYSVQYLSGSLEVQASYSDLDELISSIIGTALSVVAIVFIVIGSVIALSIIITIICCCCVCTACCHKTTTVGSVGYIQPPPTVVISNPTTSPLVNVNQTPHYI